MVIILLQKKLAKSIEIEWTDITIELLPNEYNNQLPFLRVHIGNEKSNILKPSSLGLVKSSDHKEQNELFILLKIFGQYGHCLLYTSPSPRDSCASRMPSSA